MVKKGGADNNNAQMFLIGLIVAILIIILVLVVIHFATPNSKIDIIREIKGHSTKEHASSEHNGKISS